MDIVHIASELAPIAKVGGLGDVTYGLSKALVKKGHRVRVFLPKYDCLNYHLLEDLQILEKSFFVQEAGISIENTLWSARLHDIEVVFLETHHPKGYFLRGKIYGEKDDASRFLYFSKAISTYLEKSPPDVVHLHDWPTAACTLFLEKVAKTVFTIHNMQHQGLCPLNALQAFGFSVDENAVRDLHDHEKLNLLRTAIQYSDVITAVSPTYAWEILTPEGGFGLDKELINHKKKLKGILNGIDTDYWDPHADPFLVQNYSMEDVTEGKRANKNHIQKHFMLPLAKQKPLVTAVTRLVSQKGPDLIQYGIEKTIELGGQFVLLGSTSDPNLQAQFRDLANHEDVAIHMEYDEPLAHLLYAASDMFLMPSIFEPCGLTQMIALRYGSVPLVRATGGLKDTIKDSETGFVFDIPDNKGVDSVLERAFETFEKKDEWTPLIQNGMQADFSWNTSANHYLKLYQS